MLKTFLTHSKDIRRSSYIWNTTGSVLLAFQSVILLMVITRALDLSDAGIFTLAFANATLFLNMGKYGMRVFQLSDVKGQFSFEEYCASRCVTVFLMLACGAVYDIYATVRNQYSPEKSLIIFIMCLLKASDAVEDVYASQYQRNNRLDIGAKLTTVRVGVTTLFFGVCIVLLRDLLLSLVLSTVLTYVLLFVMVWWTNEPFDGALKLTKGFAVRRRSGARALLRICFPLFASAFLSYYIGNAPKYAIDANLNDELQACYGFISLPVSVVGMLSNFIFYPILYAMTQLWADGKIERFVRRFMTQMGIILLITLACLAGCFLLGIPVLSVMYHTDLTAYRRELMILMVGGGFLGACWLLGYVITIIRSQKLVIWAYGAVSLLALFCAGAVVRRYGIMGASVLYTVLMGLLCAGLAGIFIIGVAKEKRRLAGNGDTQV